MTSRDMPSRPSSGPYYTEFWGKPLWASLSVLALVSFLVFHGDGVLVSGLQRFSDWMAMWFPQLSLIAETRQNPIGTKIVLATVIGMMPIQVAYFILTMPVSFRRKISSRSVLVHGLWVAAWGLLVLSGSIFITMYGVLLTPGDTDPGFYAERYAVVFEYSFFSGLFLFLQTYIISAMFSVLVVSLCLLLSDCFRR